LDPCDIGSNLGKQLATVCSRKKSRRWEDEAMLRAEIRWMKNGPTLKMVGSLVGEWAEQARSLVTEDIIPKGLIVDLTEISFVDCVGEQLLKWLGSLGAEFVARSIYALDLCERLDLPLLVLARPKQQSRNTGERVRMVHSEAGGPGPVRA
jgi:hypothetical protein